MLLLATGEANAGACDEPARAAIRAYAAPPAGSDPYAQCVTAANTATSSPPPPPPPPSSPAPASSPLIIAASDIKLSHSVFALPFALLGAFLSAATPTTTATAGTALSAPIDWQRFTGQLALVIVCMVLARTWAMLVNRIADARFDAANPRTRGRAVASGRLSRAQAISLALSSAGGFVLACVGFLALFDNPWPLALSVPVLMWLALYSYAKRFTALCHVLLGSALAISPLAAALAINPASLAHTPSLYALSAMVLCWVAGFDIIYALQDESFDRSAGLFSIPATLGATNAAYISRGFHALAAVALIVAWKLEQHFGPLFLIAALIAIACLFFEHIVLVRRGLAGLPLAFFTLNGVVSCVVGGAGIMDVLM